MTLLDEDEEDGGMVEHFFSQEVMKNLMLRAMTVTLMKLKKRRIGRITHSNIREVLAKHASLIFNSGPHENEAEEQAEAASSTNATHLKWV